MNVEIPVNLSLVLKCCAQGHSPCGHEAGTLTTGPPSLFHLVLFLHVDSKWEKIVPVTVFVRHLL